MESTSDPTKLFTESTEHNKSASSPREMFADSEQTEKLKDALIENIFDVNAEELDSHTGSKVQESLKKMFLSSKAPEEEDINEVLN